MKDTEIEKRFYLTNEVDLYSNLDKLGKRVSENHQIDTYYIPVHRNFLAEEDPFEWLRLRDEEGRGSITYKHWHLEGSKEGTHCDEYNSTVGDLESMKKILQALDFEVVVVVDKNRVTYKVRNFEVAVDDVEDLGKFIEIEIKSGYESVEEGTEQIYKLASELGLEELPNDHPVRTGYPMPIYLKNKDKSLLETSGHVKHGL